MAAAMPAGPAPMMAMSTMSAGRPGAIWGDASNAMGCLHRLGRSWSRIPGFGQQVAHAVLRTDGHARLPRHHAALAVGHAVDLQQAFEAHAHHAVRRAALTRDG